jgi:DNA-binding transcriptional ArsR family regulator
MGPNLANEVRRTIVRLLRDGEMTAGAIAEALARPRPGVSHHLTTLLEAGIVRVAVKGSARIYTLDDERAQDAWNDLLEAATDGVSAGEP